MLLTRIKRYTTKTKDINRKQNERKNLLQRRGHCKYAWCE